MKRILSIGLIGLGLLCFISYGDIITTKQGTVYFDVSVVSNRSDIYGIVIKHRSGAVKLDFSELPDDLKIKYGYDADKIAIAEKQIKEKQIEKEKQLEKEKAEKSQAEKENELAKAKQLLEKAEKERIERLNNYRIVKDIVYDFTPYYSVKKKTSDLESEYQKVKNQDTLEGVTQAGEILDRKIKLMLSVSKYRVKGKVIQVTDNGLLISDILSEKTVLVKDYENENLITDDDEINVSGLYLGRTQYIAVSGGQKTVPLFYCSKKLPEDFKLKEKEVKQLPY